MNGFADEVYIDVRSGNGGAGCVSFRREKFVPKGGPDGGDGGKGGDIVFVCRRNVKALTFFKKTRSFSAENGHQGSGRCKQGEDGKDKIIEVPPGTSIIDANTGLQIKDMVGDEPFVFLKGGRGGKGNTHFKSSVQQAPRFAQPGEEGKSARVGLILKLIADVGLIGFPNAGKSSFINSVTNSKSLVGSYPFTTLIPNLGVMNVKGNDVVIADIPGLIEGASDGRGMGLKFLKHIERCTMLLYMVDLSEQHYETKLGQLKREVLNFSSAVAAKPHLVLATKMDMEESKANFDSFEKANPGERILPMSVYDKDYVMAVKLAILEMLERNARNAV